MTEGVSTHLCSLSVQVRSKVKILSLMFILTSSYTLLTLSNNCTWQITVKCVAQRSKCPMDFSFSSILNRWGKKYNSGHVRGTSWWLFILFLSMCKKMPLERAVAYVHMKPSDINCFFLHQLLNQDFILCLMSYKWVLFVIWSLSPRMSGAKLLLIIV